jgi:S1-C subfamily serine protease
MRKQYGLPVAAKSEEQTQYIDLQPGDIIHAINNSPIALLEFFRSKIEALKPGASIALQIERDGRLRYVALEVD